MASLEPLQSPACDRCHHRQAAWRLCDRHGLTVADVCTQCAADALTHMEEYEERLKTLQEHIRPLVVRFAEGTL